MIDFSVMVLNKKLNSAWRPDIDGLRALAVLPVVLFHAFPGRLPGGFTGVDIFFVISGFLISSILTKELENGTFSLLSFYSRRVRRIFPALLLVLLSALVWSGAYFLPGGYAALGKHTAVASIFGSNIVLWQESGYFDTAAHTKPLLHLWSLAVEEQFYLVWPLLLMLAFRWNLSKLILMVLFVMLSLGVCVICTPRYPHGSFYLPVTRFWEIGAGALLAWIHDYGMQEGSSFARYKTILKQIGSWIGVALVGCAFAFISRDRAFPGWWALVPVLGAVLIIASGPEAHVNRVLLSNPVAIGLGKISYPLYLWHWPLLVFANLWQDEGFAPRSVKIAMVALSFVLAWLTTHLVEYPIRFGRWRKSKKAILALVTVWGVLGVVGLMVKLKSSQNKKMAFYEKYTNAEWTDWEFPGELTKGSIRGFTFYEKRTKNSNKTIFLGDSNAEQYYPRIIKVIHCFPEKSNSVMFKTGAGCPPLSFSSVSSSFLANKLLDYTQAHCKTNFDDGLDLAFNTKGVDTVVISACWLKYLERIRHDRFLITLFISNVCDSIKKIKKEGLDVYFISSLPRPKYLYKKTRKAFSSELEIRRKMPIEETKSLESYSYLEELEKGALACGAEVIRPIDFVCDRQNCPLILNEFDNIYKDTTHFSSSFLKNLKTFFIDKTVILKFYRHKAEELQTP